MLVTDTSLPRLCNAFTRSANLEIPILEVGGYYYTISWKTYQILFTV